MSEVDLEALKLYDRQVTMMAPDDKFYVPMRRKELRAIIAVLERTERLEAALTALAEGVRLMNGALAALEASDERPA